MNIKMMKICIYLALGFFLSHLFHAITYWSQGSSVLATWLTNFAPSSPAFTILIRNALILAGMHSICTLVVSILLYRRFISGSLNSVLNLCIGVLFILMVTSQAISSSVLRLLYEAGFSTIFTASTIVDKVFLFPAKNDQLNKELYERLWDLLRLSIPLAIGFSAVFGGVGAISSFYDTPQDFIHRQIYRHLYLTMYFALGMGLFIMWPIFKQILIMHHSLYVQKQSYTGQQSASPYAKDHRTLDVG